MIPLMVFVVDVPEFKKLAIVLLETVCVTAAVLAVPKIPIMEELAAFEILLLVVVLPIVLPLIVNVPVEPWKPIPLTLIAAAPDTSMPPMVLLLILITSAVPVPANIAEKEVTTDKDTVMLPVAPWLPNVFPDMVPKFAFPPIICTRD